MKFIIILVLTGILMLGCSGKRPDNLGLTNGRFAPCPSKPNCVSSQETGSKNHGIKPIKCDLPVVEAKENLKKIIQSFKKATITEETPDYLRVEFKSNLIGFVDDVEFYFPGDGKIDVRSASRVGYSDLGVNRKRIERIRSLFLK